MLATGGVILTTAGSLLISRSLELVKPIEFTHMKIGTGDISSIAQARKLNDLVASYKNINMSTLVRSGDLVRVRGSFTNDEITETVRIKEVGVFAKIGTEQPILFGYVNDGEGELIPPGTSGVIARTRDLYIGVTGEAEVAITINKSLVYATIEDLEEGLNRKEDKYIKRSGWNLDKTDLTENDSNKLFTPKGALNLFNTLTTNFTNGINAAKEVLRLDIVKKLNKGAYLGDAQDLKNDIDSKEPIINKNSGFNKVKTDLVENDTNKVFSAKGALDLKNWLVTNYTTLMNNIRDTLTNSINTKLPHGGYNQSAQTLKNEIDTKVSKAGDTIGSISATPLILIRDSSNENLNIRFYLPQQKIDKYFGVSSSGKFAIDSSPSLSSSTNNLVTENEESFFRKDINLISGSVIKNSNGNNVLRTSGNATILGAEGNTVPADTLTILTAGSNDKAVVRVRSGTSYVDEKIYHTGNRARVRQTHMFTVDSVSSGGFYAGSVSEYDFIFIKYNFDTYTTGSRTINSAITIPSDYRGEVPLTAFISDVTQYMMISLESGGIRVRATNDTTNSIVVFGVKII